MIVHAIKTSAKLSKRKGEKQRDNGDVRETKEHFLISYEIHTPRPSSGEKRIVGVL
jgi:hypothetical protein